MSKKTVEEALKEFQKCCESAQRVQEMMNAVLRWKEHLAYLVGQRVTATASVGSMSFDKHSIGLRLLDSRFELYIGGSVSEFQSLACQILAAFPLLPGIIKEQKEPENGQPDRDGKPPR